MYTQFWRMTLSPLPSKHRLWFFTTFLVLSTVHAYREITMTTTWALPWQHTSVSMATCEHHHDNTNLCISVSMRRNSQLYIHVHACIYMYIDTCTTMYNYVYTVHTNPPGSLLLHDTGRRPQLLQPDIPRCPGTWCQSLSQQMKHPVHRGC